VKPYSEYKKSDSKLTNKIPKNWAEASLKRTVDGCVNGIWGNEPDGKNDIACIRVADFDRASNSISTEKLTFRSVSYSERANRLVKSGDLLIEKSGGGDKTLVGAVAIFQHDFDAVTSNFVAKMSPYTGYSARFLNYCFSALYSSNINYCSIKQTTGIQNLDSEAYLQEKVGVPSYSEQQKIAQFLDYETANIDALIDEQKRLIELLKEKRQAVVSHAVTKGLNPDVPMKDSGVEWLGEVPEHWNIIPLKHIAKLNPSKSEYTGSKSALCTFIPMEKLKTNCLELDENRTISEVYLGYTYFREGDVLFAKVTPCFENRNTAVASNLTNGIGFGSSEINVFRPYKVAARFMYYRLLEDVLVNFWTSEMTGAGGLKRVPSNVIENYLIALPNATEQEKIASYLDDRIQKMDELSSEAKHNVELLEERRSALISAAVTGKIDVRDWQPPAGSDTVDSNASVQTERHYG